MNEPLFVFIALAGAAVLGFLFSASLSKRRSEQFFVDFTQLESNLKEKELAVSRLQSEKEAREMALENLQKISQDIENQSFEKEKELAGLRAENARLQDELIHLTENPIEKIKEIDVIREVPVLIFREVSVPESRKEKAKKLMHAFKKGYLDEHGTVQVSSSEAIDEVL